MSDSYIVKTLGCKANLYDSQLIEAELQKRGWKPSTDANSSRLCIVNSCTVTDEADRQSRKMAARLARDNPAAKVVVTGCGAEVDPERMAGSKGIHYVIGNRDKPELVDLILKQLEKDAGTEPSELGKVLGGARGYQEMLSRHPMDRDWYLEEGFVTPPVHLDGQSGKTRSFLKIQEGCNSFCTYCIIPYGRGPSRSIKPGEVVRQIRELVAQGVQEVVITGTNIGDYGADWAPENSEMSEQLVELFRDILNHTELKRLRVSSLDPVEITPELLDLMRENPRFCAHFHVSLQSPHSKILRLMKRKYASAEVVKCLRAIQSVGEARGIPGGVFVGMDVITGFPGETDEDFEESYRMLEDLPWTRLHVFPFSERTGTPATRLPGSVPQHIRVERARKLGALSLSRLKAHYETVLASREPLKNILLERNGGGYTDNYLRVMLETSEAENTLVSAMPANVVVDEAAGEVAFSSAGK